MFEQQRSDHLRELYWRTPPWVHDRLPPGPGWYLVTVERDVQDDGNVTRSVRIDHWDGQCWDSVGAYSHVVAWVGMPVPYDGIVREISNLIPI